MNRSALRLVVISAVVGATLAWWAATSPISPVNPNPPRPLVTRLAQLVRAAARLGLWVAMAGEEQPQPREERKDLPRMVQAVDGFPRVDHAEGW